MSPRKQIITLDFWCREEDVRKKHPWIDASYVCTVEGQRIETREKFLWQFVFEQRNGSESSAARS